MPIPSQILLLLGSGTSIAASYPTVDQITNRVLSGEGFQPYGERWILHPTTDSLTQAHISQDLAPIKTLLDWLNKQTQRRFPDRRVNYEDLAYLAGQIHDDIVDEQENPAITPFIDKTLADPEVKAALGRQWYESQSPQESAIRDRLGELAGRTRLYIESVVQILLSGRNLDVFPDILADDRVRDLNVYSLNHDTLIERVFAHRSTTSTAGSRDSMFVDGFTSADKHGIRHFNPTVYDIASTPVRPVVRLFKLHGSIDWSILGPKRDPDPTNTWLHRFTGIVTDAKRFEKSPFESVRDVPVMLVGTVNKLGAYLTANYFDLHSRFFRHLMMSEHLIVGGYGFGDKGINLRIAEWMTTSMTRRMLVIDPASLDGIRSHARGAIAGKIDLWGPERFVHWPRSIANVSWPQIADQFFQQ